jgi:hypothetical protein
MKRDMNLVREILAWTENQEHGFVSDNPKVEGYSEEEIGYHIYMMNEAGLVMAHDITSMADKSPRALLLRLTWGGYEFLGATKDDTIWSKARNTILKTTTSITFDLLMEWLKAEAREKLGLT